jgi:hypothetical protein
VRNDAVRFWLLLHLKMRAQIVMTTMVSMLAITPCVKAVTGETVQSTVASTSSSPPPPPRLPPLAAVVDPPLRRPPLSVETGSALFWKAMITSSDPSAT